MIGLGELDTTGQTLIADKGYRRASFETDLNTAGIPLIQPTLETETARTRGRHLRGFRRIIESVLAFAAAIWLNETTNQPGPARSLIAYDR
ncbi:MAG: hypothetical protein GY713_22310 [Actinomycetia bacterium]|nr:hypothetical protein [Actinomycetes bacterium]